MRAQPELFGPVASDPTVSRLLDALGEEPAGSLAAIRQARAWAREKVWRHRSPVISAGRPIIDLDATLVGSHSEKEGATPNFKRGFGFHPMLAFVDHGTDGTGEPLAAMLRPGKSNANDAADQIAVLDAALAQLPAEYRSRVLVRGDTGSGVQAFVQHVTDLPPAMRVIARRERPHPGAQLRITDHEGGSPCSPPTPRAVGSPTSRSATDSAPAPSTGSAA